MQLPFGGRRETAGTHSDSGGRWQLGDFTTNSHVILLSIVAVGIGVLSAFVALALLRLIGLFTNLFFFQRWASALVSPVGNQLGALEIVVPVLGALVVGLMARYGSERIRGHGIPEAIEAILIQGSRVRPRLAFWKPVSSAISIGSGGPFGAEGPIIMTGGAFGSIVAQFFHLTSAERKTLLVAGAAGGMSATFASPVAAVLLAVELLLFEWKPRSLIPVALASAAATVMRRYIIGLGPLFPVPPHPAFIGADGLFGCVLVGLLAGALSALLTVSVYAAEDFFVKLPIHWMWWPALGGLVIGVGGWICPQALGVGYDSIGALLQGGMSVRLMLGLLVVKWIIWSVSLGSGTSGGVLAPLLMMGGTLGGLMSTMLPNEGLGFWPLVSMGAILGGTMRSPFTGVIFVLELTHDVTALLPLLAATVIAHGFTVLTLRRSILTEKVARRGFHLSREYSVDPLEILFVREVMRTNIAAFPPSMLLKEFGQALSSGPRLKQRLYPVANTDGHLLGVVTQSDVQTHVQPQSPKSDDRPLAEIARPDPVRAYPDEPLTTVVDRMASTRLTEFPVVDRRDPRKLLGLVSLDDLLQARIRRLDEEHRRERVFPLRLMFPRGTGISGAKPVEGERLDRSMKKGNDAKWRRVINPDCWNGGNGGFNETNAKMVCKKCHQEFPFDLKCATCGSSKLVLGTAMGVPGIFCSACHQGQWHWDCPGCKRRQDFGASFFYDQTAIVIRAHRVA